MKNLFKARIMLSFGLIVCAVVIGFTMAGCDDLTNLTKSALTGNVNLDKPSPKVGDKITATYAPGNGTGAQTWQWFRVGTGAEDLIQSAVTNAYTATADDVGKKIKVQVSFADRTGSLSAITTNAVETAVNVIDPSLPTLSGNITISPAFAVTNTELTATYTGSESVSYQWKRNDGNVGINSNKYTPTVEGSYTVTVSAAGYHSKTSAAVTVYPPDTTAAERPVITKEPTSSNYIQYDTPVPLSVTAAVSAGTLTYQWYTNTTFSAAGGQIINGAETDTYTPSTATLGDTYYYVVVTNTDSTKDTPIAARASSPVRIRVTATVDIGTPNATITVDTNTRYQYVQGFGGMSNAWTSHALINADIDRLYSPDGFGFNIFRIMIYPYMDDLFNGVQPAPAGDPTAHTRYYEMVSRAKSHGAKILATPWTPPSEWKSNNSIVGNGYLLPERWSDYANHLKNYIARMAENGASIDYISIQNEPDIDLSYEGCRWTAEEMRDFVKQYARTIAPANGPVKIMPGESYNYGSNSGNPIGGSNEQNYYNPIINDPDAVAAIDLIGGHIYGNGLRRHAGAINAGKEVWMTEHNINTVSNPNADPQWGRVWVFTKEVHDCMAADFSAFIWWYSKRFYSFVGDGTAGTLNGQPLYRGYALSHYAKYATGKTRVAVSVTGISANSAHANYPNTPANPARDSVYVTAYESDSEITLVMFNQGNTAIGDVHIKLPVEVETASMVMTRGERPSQVETEGQAMVPQLILLDTDKKTAAIDVPASCIISVRFTKGAAQ